MFWGCHHFRKHPCRIVLRWIMFWVPCAWEQFLGIKNTYLLLIELAFKRDFRIPVNKKTPANHEQKFHEQKKTPERKKIFHDSEALWGRKLGSQDSESPGMGKVYLLARVWWTKIWHTWKHSPKERQWTSAAMSCLLPVQYEFPKSRDQTLI